MSPIWKQRLGDAPIVVKADRVLSVGPDAEGKPACWYEANGTVSWRVGLSVTGADLPAGATFLGTFAVPREGVLHGWVMRA